jgi:PAS domain S-box-containing protein
MHPSDGGQTLPGMVQEALARIQTLLDTLFETAEDAIFLMDGLRFVDCNPATLRMFRCRKEDVVGQAPWHFSPDRQPDGSSSAEKAARLVSAAMAGAPQQFEWRHCQLDRTEFDVETRLSRCLVGDVPFLVAVVRDITARKQAEAQARQATQFLERVVDSLPGVFYVYDSELRLRRWNKNFELATGCTADELRGSQLGARCATEEIRRTVTANARRMLERDGAADFMEVEILSSNGSLVWFFGSVVRVDSESGPLLVGVGIDVSARVRAERALAASERSYRELFDATNDAVLVYDEGGHVLDLNERARAMFGLDIAQARRLSIDDLSLGEPPNAPREALDRIERAVHEGPQVFDGRSRRSDGTVFWTETALRAFRFDDEARVIASVRDITERKLAAFERERLMTDLEAANTAKDQFLAVLSHELRNPLAAIQAGADMLRRSEISNERASHAVDVIERNVKLQARLVNDLLDLSRLVRGKLTLQRAVVGLGELALSAVDACRADAARAGVSLDARAESGLWVDADADRVQQIVVNLVDNAIKFTPKGGRVNVAVMSKERRGLIVVEDTGVGFEAARLPYLFEMFRQGEVAARRAPGLGIGLALVKMFAELHGGRVRAESAGPGRGSRFTVELPLTAAPRPAGAGRISDSGPARVKMLLIEDNVDTRNLLADSFGEYGYDVLTAENAEAALELIAREEVDVIVSDIGLPGMDGYEFLRRARELPSARHATAFALTGFGLEADLRRARDAGYVDHFVKPLDVEEMNRRIRARSPARRP